jgi:histidinol-phosphate aminotransferase
MDHPSLIISRPEIYATPLAYHGALDFAELEALNLDPDAVLDFSVNSNPYGPAPGVAEALAAVPLDRYPDREVLALRRALADHLDISPDNIVVANGTSELLWLVAFAYLQPCDWSLIIGPTFGEYSRTASLMGARLQMWRAAPDKNFTVSSEAVQRQLFHLKPQMMFVCNPNNPTGQHLPLDLIATWAARYPDTLFVVDEAYLAFGNALPSALRLGRDNILVLRSMTKDYALAGLRLGYAASHNAEIISTLARIRPAWNVNALAQAAGLAALQDQLYLQRSLDALRQAKEQLVEDLETLGLKPIPSTTHFFLMKVGDGTAFRLNLLKQGILVRDCTSFGLPAYVRIAARKPEENQRLLTAVEQLVATGTVVGR